MRLSKKQAPLEPVFLFSLVGSVEIRRTEVGKGGA